jgi:hypothetical protein
VRRILSRLGLFIIALVGWYLTGVFLSGFGPPSGRTLEYLIPLVLAFGSMYAVPTVLIAAIADALASIWFKRLPTLGFLLLALGALGCCFLAFLYPALHDMDQFLVYPGRSTVAVLAIYTIANAMRELRASR